MSLSINERKQRIAYLDVARGIGILLVILGHIAPTGTPLRMAIYSFHIPLFFHPFRDDNETN